ncbi:MAG: hypothetical protein WC637_14605 [Victivallales bacterium]|jgi:hypothetical protein
MKVAALLMVVLVAVCCEAALAQVNDKEPKDLTRARQTYLDKIKTATDPIRQRYIGELEKMKKALGTKGDAKGAMAVQKEIDLITQETTKRVTLEGQWELSKEGKTLGTCFVLEDGEQMTFVNETGRRSRVVRENEGSVIAVDWDVKGKVSPDGKKIQWSNGVDWKR